MQNSVKKFGQNSIVFKKADILYETLKTLVLDETLHTFPTYQCLQKRFFLILIRYWKKLLEKL